MFGEVFEVLLVAGGTAAIYALYSKYFLPWRVRRYVWRMDVGLDRQPKILIDFAEGAETELYRRPSTGYGAAVSTGLVVNSLNSAQARMFSRRAIGIHVPPDIVFASDGQALGWKYENDLVVIGGPKNNTICREVLTRVGCQASWPGTDELEELTFGCKSVNDRIGIAVSGNGIWWYGQKYVGSVTAEDGRSSDISSFNGTDYGVILRIPNPFAPPETGLRTMVLFGSQTFGVIAATKALLQFTESSQRRTEAGRMLRRKANVALLVQVEVERGQIFARPRAIDCRVLSRDLRGLGQ